MNTKYLIIIFILSISCTKNNSSSVNVKSITNDIPVRVAKVETETQNVNILTHGLVTTGEQVNLSFTIPGIIQESYVKEGDIIRKGQMLAKLDYTEITAQENQVIQNLEKTQRDYQRMKNLYKDGVISLEELQNTKTALDVTQQSLNTITYNKEHAKIESPSNGIVLKKLANKGEFINPGMPVYVISKEVAGGFIVKATITANDWIKIKKGDKAKIQIEAYPNHIFNGNVKHISEFADPRSGLYMIDIQLYSENMRITEGMFAKVEIISSQNTEYSVIPINCITEREGDNAYIYIPDKNKVKKIQVTIISIKDEKVFINNLKNINSVISDGAAFLSENSTITIQ